MGWFTGHPRPDQWAAFARGELNGDRRERLEAHLERCGRCQDELARVRAVRALMGQPLEEPDELHWRRMEVRLLERLDEEGPSPEVGYISMDIGARDELSGGTVDLRPQTLRGRRWLAAGLTAAAVVFGFLAAFPYLQSGGRPAPAPPVPTAWELREGAALLRSGAAPLRVELVSGYRVDLASASEVMVEQPERVPPAFVLDHGRMQVLAPVPVEAGAAPKVDAAPMSGPVRVQTPEVEIWARSRDFTVVHEAPTPYVEVRAGTVEVPALGLTIPAGERAALVPSTPHRSEPSPTADSRRSSARRRRRPVVERATSPRKEAPPSTPSPEPPSDADATAEADATPRARAETTVEVLAPDDSGPAAKLAQARKAWFLDRQPERAVELAEAVADAGDATPGQAREALDIACDARVSLEQGAPARRVCARLLDHETDPERRRRIHFTLATVLRDREGDCERAVDHYGKALVFGRRGRFDLEVRLRRAECAIELGRLDLARSDLARIDEAEAWSARAERARRRLENLESNAETGTK